MRRADRLFEIIQVLRRANGPMTANAIAVELEIGKRTIYRDIAALMAQRVPIRGEAGVGYVLERGFDLPPLMLTTDEVEAVVLGSQWVVAHAEHELARAALDVLAKVAAIVPEDLRSLIDTPAVGTPPSRSIAKDGEDGGDASIARLREWSRKGRKLAFDYDDETGNATSRIVWPFLLGYISTVRVVIAWCEMRRDYRIFRSDRMKSLHFLDEKYLERPSALRRCWEATNGQQRSVCAGSDVETATRKP